MTFTSSEGLEIERVLSKNTQKGQKKSRKASPVAEYPTLVRNPNFDGVKDNRIFITKEEADGLSDDENCEVKRQKLETML